MNDDTTPHTDDLLDRIRADDPRVDVVIRCLVAYRLGWSKDDRLDQVMPLMLDSMAAGPVVVMAKRLLEHVDALTVRELTGVHGEDALFEAVSRIDPRVLALTAERDRYRAAWEKLRDQAEQRTDTHPHETGS